MTATATGTSMTGRGRGRCSRCRRLARTPRANLPLRDLEHHLMTTITDSEVVVRHLSDDNRKLYMLLAGPLRLVKDAGDVLFTQLKRLFAYADKKREKAT